MCCARQGAKRPLGRGKPYGRMGAISAGGYPPKRKTRRGEDPDYAGQLCDALCCGSQEQYNHMQRW